MFCIGIRAGLLQHCRIDTSSVSSFAFSCALGAHDERNAALLCCLWLVTRASARTQASSSKFAAQRRERSAYTAPSKRATRKDDAQSAALGGAFRSCSE